MQEAAEAAAAEHAVALQQQEARIAALEAAAAAAPRMGDWERQQLALQVFWICLKYTENSGSFVARSISY